MPPRDVPQAKPDASRVKEEILATQQNISNQTFLLRRLRSNYYLECQKLLQEQQKLIQLVASKQVE